MKIDMELVKELRARTGAGIMDCKNALEESNGDIEKAIEILRKKGIAKAAKKIGRVTKDGVIYAYIHPGNRVGAIVEINCETDFVARTEEFIRFAKDIAMQVTATNPVAVSSEDVPEEIIKKEKDIYFEQAKATGKPEKVIEKIVESKLEGFFKENCLLEQPFFKEPTKTVEEYLKETISKFGENIVIKRFTRYALGE